MISIKSILPLLLVVTALLALALGADETVTNIRGGANTIIAEAQNKDLQEQAHRMLIGGGIWDFFKDMMDMVQKLIDFVSKVTQFCVNNANESDAIKAFCDDLM